MVSRRAQHAELPRAGPPLVLRTKRLTTHHEWVQRQYEVPIPEKAPTKDNNITAKDDAALNHCHHKISHHATAQPDKLTRFKWLSQREARIYESL